MNATLVEAVTRAIFHDQTAVKPTVTAVTGGDINHAARVTFGDRPYFVKWNAAVKYPRMFALEANGLHALNSANAITTPHVVATAETAHDAFLVLDFVETGAQPTSFWNTFGKQLASLHRHTHKLFGFKEDNYIGSLFQSNMQLRSWADFYVINRLDVQLEMAFNAGKIHQSVSRAFNVLYTKLEELVPQEAPALLHGDLWGGNYLVGPHGAPVLIDPAVYYGHREMDLAMMHLFGGFSSQLFQTYHEVFPLQSGWQERLPIHQLYPLLVHVNLFGGGYVKQVEHVLKRFV